jgi:hypothetical protein
MRWHSNLLAAGLIAVATATPAAADVVAQFNNTSGNPLLIGGPVFVGQMFTTAAGSSHDDLVFNFYSDKNATVAEATGTAYLLNQTYLGSASAMSSSTPGYLGSATASGNEYTFNPTVTLAANTTYYLYQNGTGLPIVAANSGGPATYTSAGGGYSPYSSTAFFTLTGNQAGVPEPSFVAMTGLVGAALAFARLRKRRSSSSLPASASRT